MEPVVEKAQLRYSFKKNVRGKNQRQQKNNPKELRHNNLPRAALALIFNAGDSTFFTPINRRRQSGIWSHGMNVTG